MTTVDSSTGLVHDAHDLAEILLSELPQRWHHSAGVARRAERLAGTVPPGDAGLLVAAAWLHDIGYSTVVRTSGFHPLDGARYLTAHGWPTRLAGLVAHHSEALAVARVRGLEHELAAFPRERSAVADALAYADQTVGPSGRRMSIEQRLTDMLRRHGPDSPNATAHPRRAPQLRASAGRVEQRLVAIRRATAIRHGSAPG